jgi:hypothetical protein
MGNLLLMFILTLAFIASSNPQGTWAQKPSGKELARLTEEYIKATIEYRASLEKLRASYQRDVSRAEQELIRAKELYAKNLIGATDVDASVRALAATNEKIKEVDQQIVAAERQLADALRENAKTGESTRRPSVVESAELQIGELISRAEDHFRKGKLQLEDNKRHEAREEFNAAVDVILYSGFDIRASQRLQAFYLDLIERIYSEEVPLGARETVAGAPGPKPPQIGFREGKFEPSPLDELSRLVLTPEEQNLSQSDSLTLRSANSCGPKLIKQAQLRGFRLGMTAAEVKARLPVIKSPVPNASGYAQVSISFMKGIGRPAFLNGVMTMGFDFIDGRVSSIAVLYDDSIKWSSLEQFTQQVSSSLDLPAVWRSYPLNGRQQRMLQCDKLRFVATMLRTASISAPALFLVDDAGIDKLITRRQAVLENVRKAEELKRQKRIQEEEQRRKAFKP